MNNAPAKALSALETIESDRFEGLFYFKFSSAPRTRFL
jgi:hypothetical protein